MSREIQVIAPTNKERFLVNGLVVNKLKRVAAYARVSSEKDQQLNSFDNQVEEWNRRLVNDTTIDFVGVYSDEGISGTSDERRPGFLKMIADAKAGKIDKIMTKSISRFARNVADSINIARELKEIGVEIYFDNEHISTLDPTTEVLFTLSAVMAQEESRHISDNVKWTFSKMFKEGIPMVSSNLIGYRRDPDNKKNLIIVPEEAEIIRTIFTLYTEGVGTNEICRILQRKGYKTRKDFTKWYGTTINGIIKNEKYCGDLLLQKSFTPDFLTHKRVMNDGLMHQYYIKDNHEPIISREMWEKAQVILERNANRFRGAIKDKRKYLSRYPLSGLILCGECGNTYKRRQWTQGYPTPRIVFQCNTYVYGEKGNRCTNKSVSEDAIYTAICETINTVFLSSSKITTSLQRLIESHLDVDGVQGKIDEFNKMLAKLDKELDDITTKRSAATNDVEIDILDRQYRTRMKEYKEIYKEIESLKSKQKDAGYTKVRMQKMKDILEKKEITPEMITQPLLQTLIQNVIIVDKEHIVIVLADSDVHTNKEVSSRRKELIDKEAILKGVAHIDRPFRPETLYYKVVMI